MASINRRREQRQALDVIAALDTVNRTRELTIIERARLLKAVRCGVKGQRRWLRRDRERLRRYLDRGKKPAQIAPLLGRTERAVWRMIYRQGWKVRDAGQCSMASRGPK
jgi:hypothetical protein